MKTDQGRNATGAFRCLKRPWSRGCFHFKFSRYPLHSLINATGVQITCFSPKRRIMERRSLFWQTDHRALGLARGLGNQGKVSQWGVVVNSGMCQSGSMISEGQSRPTGSEEGPIHLCNPLSFFEGNWRCWQESPKASDWFLPNMNQSFVLEESQGEKRWSRRGDGDFENSEL